MTHTGPKKKPFLQVVREGNPGKRPLSEGAKFVSGTLVEPDWNNWFPTAQRGDNKRPENIKAQQTAKEMWTRLAPQLQRATGLSDAQSFTLLDYCLTVARLEQAERDISIRGPLVQNARGEEVRNPYAIYLSHYRQNLRSLMGELGLSPSAAARLTGGSDDDDADDGFDD